MKQYRLKITWSNGDSEYMGGALEVPQRVLDDTLQMFGDAYPFYRLAEKLIFKAHVRKVEYEEIIPDKEVRF